MSLELEMALTRIKNAETKKNYILWTCKCGHEVMSTERPTPIRWTDGHVCQFHVAEESITVDQKEVFKSARAMIKKATFLVLTQIDESNRTVAALDHLKKAEDLLEKEVMFREKR
jgi:hypothetical protein